MTLLILTLVIVWWIAVWGLFDMVILHLTRGQKILLYCSIIASLVIFLELNPTMLDYFTG